MLDNVYIHAAASMDRPVAGYRSRTSRALGGEGKAFHRGLLAWSIIDDVLGMAVSGQDPYLDIGTS
tara:strand:+ start:834 stop:1031 length:198 start_codon:yes stop_codon:yes gene_type:complete